MKEGVIINIGNLEQVPVGQGRCFIIKGEEIAVFRSRQGELFAVQHRCPHRKGPLSEGIIGSGKVICPLHGHKFDLKTGKGNEADECVRVFNVWAENGNVLIEYTREAVDANELQGLNSISGK